MAEHEHLHTHIFDGTPNSRHMKHDHEDGDKPHSHEEAEDSSEMAEMWEEE